MSGGFWWRKVEAGTGDLCRTLQFTWHFLIHCLWSCVCPHPTHGEISFVVRWTEMQASLPSYSNDRRGDKSWESKIFLEMMPSLARGGC